MYSEAESSLIALCLKGDRQAQYTLYKRYSDAMYNVCHRMLGNEAEAEDTLQESFIDVFRRLDSFRAESSLGAWIKRIVINHCLNVFKKRRIKFEEISERADNIPEEEIEDHEEVVYEVRKMKQAMMKLPDGYRRVDVNTSYTGVKLRFLPGASFTIDAQNNYCPVNHHDLRVTEDIQKAGSTILKASKGTGGGLIIARMNYGELSID